MPNHDHSIDRLFYALGDPTRRVVIERLCRGPATVSELAKPFGMALPSFTQHLGVLETCGLVRSSKTGRVRTYYIEPKRLKAAGRWIDAQRKMWKKRGDLLG